MDKLVEITSEAYNSYFEFYNQNIDKVKPLAKKYSGLLPLLGDEKIGYIVVQKKPFTVHAILAEPLKLRVTTSIEALYFYDHLIARIRYLFRIILNNTFLHADDYRVSFEGEYYSFMISLLKDNRDSMIIQDDLLFDSKVSIEDYRKSYYNESRDTLLRNNDVTSDNFIDIKETTWNQKDILNIIHYLYPITNTDIRSILLKNEELFWLYLFTFYVSFKEKNATL